MIGRKCKIFIVPDTELTENRTFNNFKRLFNFINNWGVLHKYPINIITGLPVMYQNHILKLENKNDNISILTSNNENETKFNSNIFAKIINNLNILDEKNSDYDVFILKMSSSTTIDVDSFDEILDKTIKKNENVDLIYFCRWLDDCIPINLGKKLFKDKSYVSYETHDPHGVQALYFSNRGFKLFAQHFSTINGGDKRIDVDNLLRRLITKTLSTEKMNTLDFNALAIDPNVFNYDATLLEENMLNYFKLNPCAPKNRNLIKTKNTSFGVFWFIVIVIATLILVYIYTKWVQKYNKSKI